VNALPRYPVLLFVCSLVVLFLSVQLGVLASKRLRSSGAEKEDLGTVINASLTLLALIIGFSFSMAVNRYDQRKNYEEEEANAIGTEYVRADLLPVADGTRIQSLLKQYLAERVLFYTVRNEQKLAQSEDETAKLQGQMWSIVRQSAAAQPTAPVALAVAGMNDVLNRQGYTQAAWWNRIPLGAWALMAALAICCCALIGYDSNRRGAVLVTVLPFILSIAFFLISDIDSPRRGVIRVRPQNLISLADSLHAQ
jgi:hypothetical protein